MKTAAILIATWVFSVVSSFAQNVVAQPSPLPPGSHSPQASPTDVQASETLKKPILDSAPVKLQEVDVIGKLNEARSRISPSLGATSYSVNSHDVQSQSQGVNAPLNHIILRLPGVSQDSAASSLIHVRDEHANVQYRINDVLIPEGISGFSTEFDSRLIDRMDLITGALPAQFGFRTAGIVDIHTKEGTFINGGDLGLYGGSFETVRPSFEYGGHEGKLNYFFAGSRMENNLGIENPTSKYTALHDYTQQDRGFSYLSYLLDDTSRLSLILSGAYNHFQIPNTPGQVIGSDPAGNTLVINGVPTFDSTVLNERQTEQNDYGILAYQKSLNDLDFQASVFTRYSQVFFQPDFNGDLFFNGLAGQTRRTLLSNGIQFDSSYKLTDSHTLRSGIILDAENYQERDTTAVFLTNNTGAQIAFSPMLVEDSTSHSAYFYGYYLQDEWKITPPWTVNFGGRLDRYEGIGVSMNKISPRVNTTYEMDKKTTIHAGYAQYFTPPPLEPVTPGTVAKFASTTGAPAATFQDDPVVPERAHYFDAGLTHKFTADFQMGADAFYKTAVNQLDDGQFGTAPIITAFNYRTGEIYGSELTANYHKDGFEAYSNFSFDHAVGREFGSAQFRFSQDDLDFSRNNSIHLDHDQRFSGSFGLAYLLNETRMYADLIYGSGLRRGPHNTDHVPDYNSLNIGVEQGFKFAGIENLKARFDVVNVMDNIYLIRDGSGIGVGAAAYGQRRGYYGGLSWSF